MRVVRYCITISALVALTLQPAFAGKPLKDIEVRLYGNRPRGFYVMPNADATTDKSGRANFGILPEGHYALAFYPVIGPDPQPDGSPTGCWWTEVKIHVVITGVFEGTIERDYDAKSHSSTCATGEVVPLVGFSADGKNSVGVIVTAQ
jgi:hypothetical protein